tara:strand:+ start:1861 stop:2241 length:381 start_codon:yes stop_codon:yes gene_type:complete
MAYYEHLPIYKAAYDFALYCEKIVSRFSKQHRYRIGGDLLDLSRLIARLVVRANNRQDKLPVLYKLRETLEELKLIIRLCKDIKAFHNFNSFETSIKHVIDISKQNEGWIRSQGGKGFGPEPSPDA